MLQRAAAFDRIGPAESFTQRPESWGREVGGTCADAARSAPAAGANGCIRRLFDLVHRRSRYFAKDASTGTYTSLRDAPMRFRHGMFSGKTTLPWPAGV